MVWLPVETVMWVAVPGHLRVAFLCAVSLMWQVALSTLSYRPGPDDAPAPPKGFKRHPRLAFPVMSDIAKFNRSPSREGEASGAPWK